MITGGNGANTGRWGMSWQLWVLIAAAATGVIAVLAVKLHRAQQVFDHIVDQSRSDQSRRAPSRVDRVDEFRADEAPVHDLARQRRRHQFRPALAAPTAHPQHRSRGHH
ncbi:hypothetical protein GCM10009789_71120 [Kribbella sancticallisti]|uniref:Secreted protein n=1 Tax=Kribbella sancticallisti TaxID=460087 RepID=A0ABP4QDU3_9ACTN